MSQPQSYYPQQPYQPPTYQPPTAVKRSKLVVPAWLALSFGIVGAVFIPVPILNNATALLAFVGVICGIVGLFGTRKLVAAIGLVLCLGGIIGTVAIQAHWTKQLDQITRDLNNTP